MLPLKSYFKDKLRIEIFDKTEDMGEASASFVADKLNRAIQEKDSASLIIGTGASQFPFLNALLRKQINWNKINLFHLDEYIGLSNRHPASFRRFLKERVADIVHPQHVYYLNGDADDITSEIKRYEMLLKSHPVDVGCIGIGGNGHIAFNDPAVADFNDPQYLKVVEMDEACRRQQVGEGWFPTINHVPKEAVTLTIKAIMDCKSLSCSVPDERKSQAVYKALTGEISTVCPASILRKHNDANLFLDSFAAKKIQV
jgi:glucosamine-6-phosphate deaminase